MLEMFFGNVGDGDAVLIREIREGRPAYAMLADAGRPYVESREGSLRKDALDYLKAREIGHLDRMIITHPHIDHIGGALRILREIPTDRLGMMYLPPEDARFVPRSFSSPEKTVNGLHHMMNVIRELTDEAKARGTLTEVLPEGTQQLTDRLRMTVIYPRSEVRRRQEEVFSALYRGEEPPYELCFRTAKERNVASLMLRLEYAGRSILISGDRYGSDWEDEDIPPCDIFKVPHHGDAKSMTEKAIRKISPRYAVISCENDAAGKKERPCEGTALMLKENVPQLLCTENRTMQCMPEATHNGICFTIEEDGTVSCRHE